VDIEAADLRSFPPLAEEPFVPGSLNFRGGGTDLFIIGKELDADIDTLIADVSIVPFEEACHLPFPELAEGATEDWISGGHSPTLARGSQSVLGGGIVAHISRSCNGLLRGGRLV